MPTPKNQADKLTEAHALELGSELIRTGGTPRRSRFEVEAGGWRIVVEVSAASELPELSPCEAAIVAVLRGRPFRLTTTMVLSELNRLAGQRKVDLFGDSTVKHALARLAKIGILSSSRAAPRGYTISSRYRDAAAADAG